MIRRKEEEKQALKTDRFLDLDSENIVLATSSSGQPFARYHIHRGFVKDKNEKEVGLLYTTTDMAMPKVR